MDNFKEQEMTKIKHSVMRNEPKITRDKLKGKVITDIQKAFETEEEKEEKKKQH